MQPWAFDLPLPVARRVLVEEVRADKRLPSPLMLRAIREEAGVSQERLGKALGVAKVTVGRWEAGTRRPRGPLLLAYLVLLDELAAVEEDS